MIILKCIHNKISSSIRNLYSKNNKFMYKKNVKKTVVLFVLLTPVMLTGQTIVYKELHKLIVFTGFWVYLVVNAFAVLLNSESPTILVTKPPVTNHINIY